MSYRFEGDTVGMSLSLQNTVKTKSDHHSHSEPGNLSKMPNVLHIIGCVLALPRSIHAMLGPLCRKVLKCFLVGNFYKSQHTGELVEKLQSLLLGESVIISLVRKRR